MIWISYTKRIMDDHCTIGLTVSVSTVSVFTDEVGAYLFERRSKHLSLG